MAEEQRKQDSGRGNAADIERKLISRKKRRMLLMIQHLALAAVAVLTLIILFGSTVNVSNVDGDTKRYYLTSPKRYYLTSTINDRSAKQKPFENSSLFNELFDKESSDVMRLGTIRMQMETDGSFDNTKIIDVTAFNNRNETLPAEYVTADYFLGDLLKWYKYGFEYEERDMTPDEQRDFLASATRYRTVDESKANGTLNYYNMNMYEYTHDQTVTGNSLNTGEADGTDPDAMNAFSILSNRYRTADGDNIEDLVSSWDEYSNLCEQIESAAHSLMINYSDYNTYMSFYGKSNFKYYILNDDGTLKQNYTNTGIKDKNEKTITQSFKKYGKYLYYSPADLIYDTNTGIPEAQFRNHIGHYIDTYPENVKIWLAVDTSYSVRDAFYQARLGYQNYIPYFWQLIVAICASLAVVLVIFVTLSVYEGRDGVLYKIDRVPAELIMLVMITVCSVISGLTLDAYDLIPTGQSFIYSAWMKVICAGAVFLYDMLIMYLYLSLVRRAKTHTFWHTTLMYYIVTWISRGMWTIYDNSGIILRTWIPLTIGVAFNAACFAARDPGWVVIVLVLDIASGVFIYRQVRERQQILKCIDRIEDGDFSYRIPTEKMHGDNLVMANAVNSIGDSISKAVDTSTKDERLKADLITNVSHDIKTPLTSIINYVDLIKREDIGNSNVKNYVKVLDEKSQRLKQLTDDLVEASKISSGNIVLNMGRINMSELVQQTIGEFSDKFDASGLTVVVENASQNPYIVADSRRIWRVVENLFNNVCKYAMTGTRVYITISDMTGPNGVQQLKTEIKNISANELNCNPDELTERFIRGDVSRTTEGSGLGLSIAKSLTQLQNGRFQIVLDGDLFKAVLIFQSCTAEGWSKDIVS
jgi:signal transduction histidine kinase